MAADWAGELGWFYLISFPMLCALMMYALDRITCAPRNTTSLRTLSLVILAMCLDLAVVRQATHAVLFHVGASVLSVIAVVMPRDHFPLMFSVCLLISVLLGCAFAIACVVT
jgi:hypothetical protein